MLAGLVIWERYNKAQDHRQHALRPITDRAPPPPWPGLCAGWCCSGTLTTGSCSASTQCSWRTYAATPGQRQSGARKWEGGSLLGGDAAGSGLRVGGAY